MLSAIVKNISEIYNNDFIVQDNDQITKSHADNYVDVSLQFGSEIIDSCVSSLKRGRSKIFDI